MTTNPQLAKADLLLRQDRPAEAERLLRQHLAGDPDNLHLLALLAAAVAGQDRPAEAVQVIDRAIGLAPEVGYLYYIRGQVLLRSDRYAEAETALREAISLDTLEPDAYALLAQVLLVRKRYHDALAAADEALALDPEHLHGLNMRGAALVKLDRREESAGTIAGALREDPDNAYTHTNYGWSLLETGDHRAAADHFAQALRREPGSDYARGGMVEALKAKNPVYKLYLRYAFWMNKLTANYQWGVIVGFYVLYRLLRWSADTYPELAPYLTPLLVLLVALGVSTWVIGPIGDLLLRLDAHGRYLLTAEETRTANVVGGCLLLTLVGLTGYVFSGAPAFLVLAGYGFSMILPVGLYYTPARTRHLLRYYAVGLALLGGAGVVVAFVGATFNLFVVGYLLGLFLFQWVANYQVIRDY
ncbi:tetratricopeptide repeat protein [Lewinella sp. IMCC34183]|uniref:tetratricopeptide repeat protein n=1 Tax=Lewinella sp. IMCC34183 TaxID=2248762 RepID=UPI000E23AA34|nr:tetratricopeptide repeat protein [Lewinella sp. IMCC34183]